MFFDGFDLQTVRCGDVTLRARQGGTGPAVVLLHGHPRTHATWHRVAVLLAARCTVVCPDLRGYGGSTVPPDAENHAQASKRAMAGDIVALMEALGYRIHGPDVMGAEAHEDVWAALRNPAVIHGMWTMS